MRDVVMELEALGAGMADLDLGGKPLSPPILAARNLVYTDHGKALINGVNLNIAAGRRTVVLGANGSGKSLLLRLLHGLIEPSQGTMFWRGRTFDAAARRAQAMVFQRPVMLRRSVLANLRFALAVRGVRGQEQRRRAEAALAMARLEERASQPARRLSGGEQQRLAIARAMACAPELLILDEPTANLDPASTHAIEALICDAQSGGATILLVTHDQGQARRLGEDALFMHAGRIVEAGPLHAMLNDPRTPQAAAWIEGRLFLEH